MRERVIRRLRRITRHENVEVVSSGNLAIFIALYLANRKKVLIPDQGGWFSYRTYPRILGFEVEEIKTRYGVVEDFECDSDSVLILNSFAGYFAEQPLKEIFKVCKENDCLLINDVSGSFCDKELCNGLYSDFIVCSFGNWKIVNLGYGGFVSCNYFRDKKIFSLSKVPFRIYRELFPLLNDSRLKFLLNLQEKVKRELSGYDVIHRDKRGINVVVRYDVNVMDYCEESGYEYVLCPRYDRVKERAISIELKRV